MALKRYKRVGTTMIERSKGEWVRWEDVKDCINYAPRMVKPETITEVKKNGNSSDKLIDSK